MIFFAFVWGYGQLEMEFYSRGIWNRWENSKVVEINVNVWQNCFICWVWCCIPQERQHSNFMSNKPIKYFNSQQYETRFQQEVQPVTTNAPQSLITSINTSQAFLYANETQPHSYIYLFILWASDKCDIIIIATDVNRKLFAIIIICLRPLPLYMHVYSLILLQSFLSFFSSFFVFLHPIIALIEGNGNSFI